MQFNAKVYLEFLHLLLSLLMPQSSQPFFHLLGVSVCSMRLFYSFSTSSATAPISIFLSISFCSFRFVSFRLVLFFVHIVQVQQCMDTNGKLTGNGTFYLECVCVCTCVNSVIHNFMRHSFCYHLVSFLTLFGFVFLFSFFGFGLQFAALFFLRVATIFSCTLSNVARIKSVRKFVEEVEKVK